MRASTRSSPPRPRAGSSEAIRERGGGIGAFDMVLIVSGSDISARSWVEQVGSRLPDLPLVSIAPTFLDPELEPYLRSGQLAALARHAARGRGVCGGRLRRVGDRVRGRSPARCRCWSACWRRWRFLAEAAFRHLGRRRRPTRRRPSALMNGFAGTRLGRDGGDLGSGAGDDRGLVLPGRLASALRPDAAPACRPGDRVPRGPGDPRRARAAIGRAPDRRALATACCWCPPWSWWRCWSARRGFPDRAIAPVAPSWSAGSPPSPWVARWSAPSCRRSPPRSRQATRPRPGPGG